MVRRILATEKEDVRAAWTRVDLNRRQVQKAPGADVGKAGCCLGRENDSIRARSQPVGRCEDGTWKCRRFPRSICQCDGGCNVKRTREPRAPNGGGVGRSRAASFFADCNTSAEVSDSVQRSKPSSNSGRRALRPATVGGSEEESQRKRTSQNVFLCTSI